MYFILRLITFGLAVRKHREGGQKEDMSSASHDDAGEAAGTLSYLAPEILRGERANVQIDIWALGTLLYEIAAGKLPFSGGRAMKSAWESWSNDPNRFRTASIPPLSDVILRCLEKDCAHRYAAAQEVHNDLGKIVLAASRLPVARLAHFFQHVATSKSASV
jgi:serine/threonine-protein kinase